MFVSDERTMNIDFSAIKESEEALKGAVSRRRDRTEGVLEQWSGGVMD
jgi:hypothetical protein